MARRRAPTRTRSLVASAAVMSQRPASLKVGRMEEWQEQAWNFYDDVGELRFAVGWLANGMSRVNLVAARTPQSLGDEPSALVLPDPDDPDAEPLSPVEELAVELVRSIAGGVDNQGQLLADAAKHLSVPGIGWILMRAEEPSPGPTITEPDVPLGPDDLPVPDETWRWSVLAYDAIRAQGDQYQMQVGESAWVDLTGAFVLVKVWRPHPRRGWEADSPIRAVRSVLTRITLLDEHVSATGQSRLAGAGLLIMPAEAEFAPLPIPTGYPIPAAEQPAEMDDDFTQTLVDTMTIPITDRGTAAAVVPLTVRIPGEFCDKVKHVTFWTEFSGEVLPLQDSAIRRLALGLDIPPEVLEGKGGMNHWGAWQVAEEAVTLHIEPMSETIVYALTIGYLRAALTAAGHGDEADDFMVWYDATDLTVRPDRSADTIALYDRVEVSGAAARRESGLSEDDAPDDDERRARWMAKLAENDANLAATFLRELSGEEPGAIPAPVPPEPAEGPPGTDQDEPQEPPVPEEQAEPSTNGLGASAVIEACDGLVYRALEKAGARLKSSMGRKVTGGASVIDCPDVTRLHVELHGATHLADLDHLLDGAWVRVPAVAARLGMDPTQLEAALDSYVRALLATGHEHDSTRLTDALGLGATV